MKPDLENELFKKYPKIFNGALIGHKVSCPDGWFHLLDELSHDIQHLCDHTPDIPQVQAVRVMMDHAGLRFYFTGGNKYIRRVVEQAENRSGFTCEECGELGSTVLSGSHFHCLCQTHAKNLSEGKVQHVS